MTSCKLAQKENEVGELNDDLKEISKDNQLTEQEEQEILKILEEAEQVTSKIDEEFSG
jgi:hypothetical protein